MKTRWRRSLGSELFFVFVVFLEKINYTGYRTYTLLIPVRVRACCLPSSFNGVKGRPNYDIGVNTDSQITKSRVDYGIVSSARYQEPGYIIIEETFVRGLIFIVGKKMIIKRLLLLRLFGGTQSRNIKNA